jgi:hypothetical protein
MNNSQAVIGDFNKYLTKLNTIISNQANFSFVGYKIIEKSKIDDVLCCLQSIIPKEYKQYQLWNRQEHQLSSQILYTELLETLNRNFLGNKNLCIVTANKTYNLISSLKKQFPIDLNIIAKNMENFPDAYN